MQVGSTPLLVATVNKKTRLVKALISHGANLELADSVSVQVHGHLIMWRLLTVYNMVLLTNDSHQTNAEHVQIPFVYIYPRNIHIPPGRVQSQLPCIRLEFTTILRCVNNSKANSITKLNQHVEVMTCGPLLSCENQPVCCESSDDKFFAI